MEALGAKRFGSFQDVLEFMQIPQLPKCEKNDVLVKVAYSDVNPVDMQKLCGGKSEGQPVPNAPFIPGYGGSGVVQDVGVSSPQHLVGKEVCFLLDPDRNGSYASHVVVDARCVAEVPPNSVELRDAASIPVAGLTAYECLVKLGMASEVKVVDGKIKSVGLGSESAASTRNSVVMHAGHPPSLLVVGGSGGVGSWIITLARALHPGLKIIATASKNSHEWCKSLGASQVIDHNEISSTLEGGRQGSVDKIICLTEPTPTLFKALTEVIKPYGKICLVVSGSSINSLDLSFCFFKCADVLTQTVFSSIRTNFDHIVPSQELDFILSLMANQTIRAPISPDIEGVSEKFKDALKDNGVLKQLQGPHRRGNFVLMLDAGDDIIFMDLKSASLFKVPRKECIQRKILTRKKRIDVEVWGEEASTLAEKEELIKKISTHKELGIVKVVDKWDDGDGIELQGAEEVKNLWGVQLKKREKNPKVRSLTIFSNLNLQVLLSSHDIFFPIKGEELLFVDPRTQAIGELSRKVCIESGFFSVVHGDQGVEALEGAVTDIDERDGVVQTVRTALDLTLS